MRNRAKIAVAAAATLAVIAGGVGIASATSKAGSNICRRTSDDALVARATCNEKGYVPAPALAVKGTKGDTGPQGPQGPRGEDGDNALKVTRASITLNADFTNGGTDAGISAPAGYVCKYLTISGAPASSTSVTELEFDNSGSNEVTGTDVRVRLANGTPVVFPLPLANNIVTTPGATTRRFQVCGSGFTGSKSFTASVAVLSIVG